MQVVKIFDKVVKSVGFKIIFFVLAFAILFSRSDRNFGWTNADAGFTHPIASDGSGYYAYLPQWFTYHTKHFEFRDSISNKYPNARFVDFVQPVNREISTNYCYNKFYPGTSICLTPFYFIAQIHASCIDQPNDGYSWPFLFWVNIGIICFSLFGGLGLFKLLRLYNVSPAISYLLVSAALFGTNICYYTTVEIPFSHVFSFALNTWVLVYAKRWSVTGKAKHFYWMCIAFGLAFSIRPTNLFILFAIPFFFQSTKNFLFVLKELVLQKRKQLFIGLCCIIGFVLFICWNVYLQTGEWKLSTYTTESFTNWKHPFLFEVLFSYKKGLFIYTPVLILLLPGLVFCFFKERRLFWGAALIFAILTYSTGAWYMWWFGGGLGARSYIDVMSIFFLVIGIFFQIAASWLKPILVCFVVVSMWFYQVFDYQMRYNILHYDTISKENFWRAFLQTDHRFMWFMILEFDDAPESRMNLKSRYYLRDGQQNSVKNNILELNKDDKNDDPQLTLKTNQLNVDNAHVGLEFHTDIRIYDHFTSPVLYLSAYRKGKMVEEKSIQFGSRIPEQDDFANIQLFLNLNAKWSSIDSVAVKFDQGLGNVGVKNQYVQFYKY